MQLKKVWRQNGKAMDERTQKIPQTTCIFIEIAMEAVWWKIYCGWIDSAILDNILEVIII